jgi:hypothetical protein
MAKKISDLDNMSGAASIDRAADMLEVSDTSGSASYKATPNFILGITGNPVGTIDVQAITNKTLDNTNTITLKDTLFTLQDDSDTTKQAKFQLSGITTGTTRTYTLPNASSTLVDLSTSQTLTNKTLTSPTINTPTIVNPTLTTDTVSEYTGANGVTVDGLNIKDGALNTNNSVVTNNITDSAVTFVKTSGIGWELLGSTTLGSAGDTMTISSITARKHLKMVIYGIATGGTISLTLRFNNDSGNNYAARYSDNNGADGTVTSTSGLPFDSGAPGAYPFLVELEVVNVLAQEKLAIAHLIAQNTAGAGTAPARRDLVGKWANTATQITRVDVLNTGTGDCAIGSTVSVWGRD